MKNKSISIAPATQQDVADLIASIEELDEKEAKVKVISSKGFGGVGEMTLIVSLLTSPAVIKGLSSVLVAWIQRNNKRTVTIGKTKLTGYSVDDVERLLKSAKSK
jgi:hypothetical protein